MDIIRTTHSYELIESLEYLCLASCLEIVLRSEGLFLSQVEIAEFFGIQALPNYSGPVCNFVATNDGYRIGMHVTENGMNRFFARNNFPFNEKYTATNTLEEWRFAELIAKALSDGDHVIVGYSFGRLNGDSKNDEFGHVALIESIDSKNVLLLDPGPKNAGRHEAGCTDLYYASRYRRAGVSVVSKTIHRQAI